MKHIKIKTPVSQGTSFECDIWDQEGHIATCRGRAPLAEQRARAIVQAVNAYDDLLAQRDEMLAVISAWLEAIQNSLALRLALTGLPDGAGVALVGMLQDTIAKAEGDK